MSEALSAKVTAFFGNSPEKIIRNIVPLLRKRIREIERNR
jgi:hypothetical protein